MKAKTFLQTTALVLAMILIVPFIIDAQIELQGLAANHEGFVTWTADGTGNEAEGQGHHFNYKTHTWFMAHYLASRDYDGIDPNADAALCHFTGKAKGFINLEKQLEYLGYTMNQLKIKSGISSVGNATEGKDWGLDGNTHWSMYYGNKLTIEIAGQAILECVIDTNYGFVDLDKPGDYWHSQTSYAYLNDISHYATTDAQLVAELFLKDLDGRPIKLTTSGKITSITINSNGRDGVFHEITSGTLTLGKKTVEKIENTSKISGNSISNNYKAEAYHSSTETGIKELSASTISVMPNPFMNELQITFELAHSRNVKVEIYNALGEKVSSIADAHVQKGKQSFSWNATGLAEGMYFCRILAGDATVTRKVIKAN
jgi:hypothetical protein